MTEIIRPGNASGIIWDTPTVTLIDDDVIQPTAGDGSYANTDFKDDNDAQVWNQFTHANGSGLSELYSSITSIKVWAYARDAGGQDEDLINSIWVSGGWSSETTWLTTGSFAWYSTEYTGTWSPTDIDDIQVELKVASNPDIQLDVLYVELDGAAATTTTTTPAPQPCDCDCGENDCPEVSGCCIYYSEEAQYWTYNVQEITEEASGVFTHFEFEEYVPIFSLGSAELGNTNFGYRSNLSLNGKNLITSNIVTSATLPDIFSAKIFRSETGSGNWSQIGQAVSGNIGGRYPSIEPSLYGDGINILRISDHETAIGTRAFLGHNFSNLSTQNTRGYIGVHEYNGSSWDMIPGISGTMFDPVDFNAWTIESFDISGSGDTVITSWSNNHCTDTKIRVVKYDGSQWNKLGSDIPAFDFGRFGVSYCSDYFRYTAMTYDGSGVMVCFAPNYTTYVDYGAANYSGIMSDYYEWDGVDWVKTMNTLTQKNGGDGSPVDVVTISIRADISLSRDGSVFGLAANNFARVYEKSGSNWVLKGDRLDTTNSSKTKMALNGNGDVVAIGTTNYVYEGGNWVEKNWDLLNKKPGNFWDNISLNDSGNIMVISRNGIPDAQIEVSQLANWSGVSYSEVTVTGVVSFDVSGIDRDAGYVHLPWVSSKTCGSIPNSYFLPSGSCPGPGQPGCSSPYSCPVWHEELKYWYCDDCPTTTTTTTTSTTTTTTTTPDPTLGSCCYLGDIAGAYLCQDLSSTDCNDLNDSVDVVDGSTIWTGGASCNDPVSPCPDVDPPSECCDWDGFGSFYGNDGDCSFTISNVMFSSTSANTWSYSNATDCGDILTAAVTCNNGNEVLLPTGNINTLWNVYDFSNIDNNMRNPATTGDSTYCTADGTDDGEEQKWSFTDPVTSYGITSVYVHVRHKDDRITSNPPAQVYAKIGGVWISGGTIDYDTTWGWSGVQFDGSWVSSDLDDFQVGLVAPGSIGHSREYNVSSVYAELTGPPETTNQWDLTSLTFPCADDVAVVGTVSPSDCGEPPVWEFTWSDAEDCMCCGQLCLWPTNFAGGAPWGGVYSTGSGCLDDGRPLHEYVNDYSSGVLTNDDYIRSSDSTDSWNMELSAPPGGTFTSATTATLHWSMRALGISGVSQVLAAVDGITSSGTKYITKTAGITCTNTIGWSTYSMDLPITGVNTLASWNNASLTMNGEFSKSSRGYLGWIYVCLTE
jgi:hypothetical protein